MSLRRDFFAGLAGLAIVSTTPAIPGNPPAPTLHYTWFPGAEAGNSLSTLPNRGTREGMDLVSTGAAVPLVTLPELNNAKALDFNIGGDFLRTASNFPIGRSESRTVYMTFRFNSDSAGDLFTFGSSRNYGTFYSLTYEGANGNGGYKRLHLSYAGMDMYVDEALLLGQFLTVAVRTETMANGYFKTTMMYGGNGYVEKWETISPLDTDPAPLRLAGDGYSRRTPDLHVLYLGLNVGLDSDKDMSNNLRQMQLACGLPARPLV